MSDEGVRPVVQLRPDWRIAADVTASPSAAYVDTCDAGGCDEETEALVLTDLGAWVSMCCEHAIHELGGYTQTDVEDDE